MFACDLKTILIIEDKSLTRAGGAQGFCWAELDPKYVHVLVLEPVNVGKRSFAGAVKVWDLKWGDYFALSSRPIVIIRALKSGIGKQESQCGSEVV
jgi:hypothetical protein